KTVYVPREKRKHSNVERDGKRLIRWEMDGDIRAWNLETGELTRIFKHDPPRAVRWMKLSPDALTILTGEALSGETGGARKTANTLWDVPTGTPRPLPDNLVEGPFSPDSKTVALAVRDAEGGFTSAIKLIDVATARERLSIPILEKFASD